ncbi:MAG: hypothetical protein ACM3X6_15175 [Patescibacteria group bacterium]
MNDTNVIKSLHEAASDALKPREDEAAKIIAVVVHVAGKPICVPVQGDLFVPLWRVQELIAKAAATKKEV